ncbi:MAG: lysophospholipid acyltransferase family protein [Tistlia sp.]|uniref:lysophospholipid acyltransferase family protein n=1 Tax=Tistlia sp. TaxID=3057121 RepID=UPI0034A40EA3
MSAPAEGPPEPPAGIALILRSALFQLAYHLWLVAIGLVLLPAFLLPRRALYAGGRLWVRGILFLLEHLCGLTWEVRGRDRLPAEGGLLIASKHQSAWDTLVFPLLVRDPAYVLKRELLLVPFFGWIMWRLRMIAVDRKGGAAALRRMLAAARRIVGRERRPLVIYPEGTRTAPGDSRPYHPGVAALYGELGVPVVPVALNSGLYWPRQSFLRRPGRIVLEFLEPIPPGLPRRQFLAELEARIEPASRRLLAEGRAATAGRTKDER